MTRLMNMISFCLGLLAVFLLLVLAASGCSTAPPSHIAECRWLCSSPRVEEFKDEGLMCRCNSSVDEE